MQNHIAISVTEGRTIRDLFANGLLDYFGEAEFDVTIFTEAIHIPEFVEHWQRPGVDFQMLYPYDFDSWRKRAFWVRRKLARIGNQSLLKYWLALEEKHLNRPRSDYVEYFRRRGTSLYLATHAHLPRETELIASAHQIGIPTLGMVRSWDNVYKGIKSRPHRLAVWNAINRQEVIEFEGYDPNHVHIVGSPQFDPYFRPDSLWSRETFCERFRLNPDRPVILYATLGYFISENDETFWMDDLLRRINAGEIDGNPQVICRLHPWSRLEHFEKYRSHPAVRLSYVSRYWPALTWYMTRDDVVEMANMIHHSAVVVTPGSTVSLEAAIFDRPVIVPIFHEYQPERMADYFATWVLGKHYKRLDQENLIPIIRSPGDFSKAINKALKEPGWYRLQRSQLVKDYVHFTDGGSTKRLVELATSLAHEYKAK